MRILIVDDNPLDRELLREKLEDARHTVEEAGDGNEALGILGRKEVDAVISDVLMPTMDGYRLCMEVRRDERLRPVPFLFYTGTYVTPDDQALGGRVGADRYLLKSAHGDGVLEALDEVVRSSRGKNGHQTPPVEDADVVREYNQVLVAKLEQRNLELTAANNALQAGEERFRQIAESIREVFWLADPVNNGVLYVSPAYVEVWGRTAESLYKSPRAWLDAVHPEDRERVLSALTTKRESGGYDEEYRILRPDGSIRWIRDRGFPIRDGSGQVYRIAGVAEDVTDRKQLEDEVREVRQREIVAAAEARLQQEVAVRMRAEEQIGRFFDTGINLHCVAGFDGFFKRLNTVWEEVTGFTREELMGVPFMEYIHPDDVEGVRGELEKLGAGSRTVGYEIRLRCRDGSYRWTQWSAVPVPDQQVIMATGQDITSRKQAEEGMKESEARLQAFMDNSNSLIFIKDTAGRYLHVNREFERSFGMKASDVLGRDDLELFPPAQARSFRTNDRKVIRSGAPVQTEEAARYNGVEHISLVSKFPMFDTEGNINAICGIATDITARKRAEGDLRRVTTRLLQMQDTERRRLGHELHDSTAQSLAALEIHLTALRKLTRNSPPRKRELVKDSLALATQSAREIRTIAYALRPPLLDEMGLVAALHSHVRSFSQRSGLKYRLLVPRDFGRPRSEVELALFRIVQEALANAHRHSGTDSVTVRLRRTQRKIVLEVADRGGGMASGTIDTYLTSQASPGMGLAGMRERARQLGGELEIHSSSRGTRVRAEIPWKPS